MNNFKIDFSDGICIENDYTDASKTISGLNHFDVKIFVKMKEQTYTLAHEQGLQGLYHKIELFDEKIRRKQILDFKMEFNQWVKPYLYKFLVPYDIEIFYNNELQFSYSFECRHKLILFNLHPKDEKELYLWMNVIDTFKKNMNCDIAVKNNLVYSTNEFDDIVDVKYNTNYVANRHFLDLHIGRFYIPNSEIADPYYHPNGLNDKNSLEIINDILYGSYSLFKNTI